MDHIVPISSSVKAADANDDGHFTPCKSGNAHPKTDHFIVQRGSSFARVCSDAPEVKRLYQELHVQDLSAPVASLDRNVELLRYLWTNKAKPDDVAERLSLANFRPAIPSLRERIAHEPYVKSLSDIAWALMVMGDRSLLSSLMNRYSARNTCSALGTTAPCTKESLQQAKTIGGVTFAKDTVLWYNRDGKLELAELSADTTVKGIPFKAGTKLWFDPHLGNLVFAYFLKEHTIGNIPCKADSIATFFNGKILRAFLARDAMIDNIPTRGSTPVEMWFDGVHLRRAELARNISFKGIPCAEKTAITLDPNGTLDVATLSSPYREFGTEYPVNSVVMFHPNGKIRSAILSADTVINGIPCKKGSFVFLADGKPVIFTLSRTHTVAGYTISANATFSGHPQHTFSIHSAKPFTVNNTMYMGGSSFGRMLEPGNVGGILASDQVVNGVPCKGGTRVNFHDNGRIANATTSQRHVVAGIALDAHSTFALHEDGRIKSVHQPKGVTVDGITFTSISDFFRNGKVASGLLSKDQTVGKIPCQTGMVQFYENGHLASCTTSKPITVNNIVCSERRPFSQHDNGELAGCDLSQPKRVGDAQCLGGRPIGFFKGGKLASCVLQGNQLIQNIPCKESSLVYFHDNGKLARGTVSERAHIEGTHYTSGAQFITLPYWEYKRTTDLTLVSGKSVNGQPSALDNSIKMMMRSISVLIENEMRQHRNEVIVKNILRLGKLSRIQYIEKPTPFRKGEQSITFNYYWKINDFVKNLRPFGDCNGSLFVDATLRWSIQNNRIVFDLDSIYPHQVAAAFPNCPLHTIAANFPLAFLTIMNVAMLKMKPLMQQKTVWQSNNGLEIGATIRTRIAELEGMAHVLKGSVALEKLWIDNDGLKARIGYKLRYHTQPPAQLP